MFAAAGSQIDGVDIEGIETSEEIAAASILPAAPDERVRRDDAMARAFETLYRRVAAWSPDVVSGHAFDAEALDLAGDLPLVHTLHLPPIVAPVVSAARSSRAALVSVSEAMRRDWAAAGVATSVIRNGVPDLLDGPPAGRSIRSRDGAGTAIVAGRVSPEKGTATAVRVARRAGLRPLVVGSLYDRRYAEAEVLPRLDPGEWLPPVSRGRLAELMAEATVLLMPVEWDEPFGLVAAEAQMAGCPVVGYRRGGLPEIVREGVTGFLADPFDEDALVARVLAAPMLDRMAIRRDALARLSLDPMLDAYERTFANVAVGSGAAAAARET